MGIFILVALILAGAAFFKVLASDDRQRRDHSQFQNLFTRIAKLEASLEKLRGELSSLQPSRTPQQEMPPAKVEVDVEAPAAPPNVATEAVTKLEESQLLGGGAPASFARASRPQAPGSKSFEEAITSRWLVWIGAVAIALGGTFLVKYVIDNGFLGPGARVTLGFLLGVALAIAGEWLRQRPLQRAIAAIQTDHVPPALTASGLFTAFASIYAAHALYDLLPPSIAFVGLAFVALLAVGLSILQGQFVALMGLLGAFVAPALVAAPNPSAWGLFAYLFVVMAACLALVRYKGWWWFALATLAGAITWPLLWMTSSHWNVDDALPLGLYLLLVVAGYFLLLRWAHRSEDHESLLEQIRGLTFSEQVVGIAACATALVLLALVSSSGHSVTGLMFAGLLAALYLGMGRYDQRFDGLIFVAAVLVLLITSTISLPGTVIRPPALPGAPLVPHELQYFSSTSMAFAALFGTCGFLALWGARRPALWASVSAAVPILLLVIAYYRIVDFGVDLAWATIALVLAGANLFAAERVERYRAARGLEVTLGVYAAAVVALISLAVAMSVRQAWLTVALSIQLPALAWVNTRVPVRSIQIIAAVVAATVLTRLVFNYNILSYPLASNPATSWVVYGYGVPAISFLWAARLFRRLDAKALITLLEAGGLAFAVLLVSLEIRLFIAGSLDAPRYGLLEQSLQSISWLSIGSGLAIYYREKNHEVSLYGALILLALAAAQVFLLQLGLSNPIWTGEFVGIYPILNVLFLAYAVPAGFAFCFAAAIGRTGRAERSPFSAGAGFVLLFTYLSLEVTRAFHGPVLSSPGQSDAEVYTYSLVWLAYALVLLGLGISFERSFLRYASLAVLVIAAIKVFLFDMAGLTGLYRAASFLGLGLSLVGIGYLYQRFVFRHPEPPEATAKPAQA